MNNSNQIENNWNDIKGKLQQRYTNLNEKDVTLTKGKLQELLLSLENKLGKTKTEIEILISDLNDNKMSSK